MKNIRIKLFSLRSKASEERVNEWIKENDIDVIDIKYQSLLDTPQIYDRVLIIYKENIQEEQ